MSDHMAVMLILLNLCFCHVRSHGCTANSVKFMFLSCQITWLAVRLILLNVCVYHVRSNGCTANSVKFMFLSCQITWLYG